jgi:hypothetical protein
LLDAVRSACLSRVAAAIEDEMKKHKAGRNPEAFARKSLRAVGMGYLGFAMREPGMFRTAFSIHRQYMNEIRRIPHRWG